MEDTVIMKLVYAVFKTKKAEQPAYTVERRMHQGKPHLVVPITMMVEGVHHGSNGPMLHLAEELGKFPGAWNGIPIVIDHPELDGENISANDPGVIDARAVGRIYNTFMDGNKLRAEAWLDEEKLRQTSPTALDAVLNGRILEVSVGVFTEDEEVAGDYHGEQYNAIARNMRPDHLALLPGGIGACSVTDGCGIRANQNKKGGNDVTTDEQTAKLSNIEAVIQNNSDQGYRALVQAAQRKLDTMDGETAMHFLQEVYDNYLVYEAQLRLGGTHLYKQDYQFNNGVFELTGNPMEVQKKVEFVPLQANKLVRTKFNNKKEEVNMRDVHTCTDCVKKRVNDLIANSNGKYTEADRAELELLSEAMLEKLAKPIEVEKVVEKTIEVNKLTDEQKADLAYAQRLRKEKKDLTIKGIQDNTSKELWPDAILSTMSDDHLDRLYNSVKKEEVADYSGMATFARIAGTDEIEPMLPAGMGLNTKK